MLVRGLIEVVPCVTEALLVGLVVLIRSKTSIIASILIVSVKATPSLTAVTTGHVLILVVVVIPITWVAIIPVVISVIVVAIILVVISGGVVAVAAHESIILPHSITVVATTSIEVTIQALVPISPPGIIAVSIRVKIAAVITVKVRHVGAPVAPNSVHIIWKTVAQHHL